MNRVKVLFPLPLSQAFDYRSDQSLAPGAFVVAPFGKTSRIGVVWPESAPDETLDDEKIKEIEEVLDCPPLAADLMAFIGWSARYVMAPLGSVLRLTIRSGDFSAPPRPSPAFRLAGPCRDDVRMTPARESVLEALAADPTPRPAKEIAEAAGVSDAVVRGLAKTGMLEQVFLDPDAPFQRPAPNAAGAALGEEQAAALEALTPRLTEAGVVLIDGVTGAGKTEVYLEAVARALAADEDAQVLIMMPEIALTTPFLKRVAARFGAEPAGWHSGMGQADRRRVWRKVISGDARIVVGARSALFLPFRRLRLIVVDEEHETAYKQEDGVIYNGRDLAVARGAAAGFPVLLASATPSLETVLNVETGRYDVVRLRKRYSGAPLPKVSSIDLRATPPEKGRWLAPDLIEAVNDRLARQEQSLLFLNRRGYAPLTICRRCGHRMKAPGSDTWLVEHRFERKLVCHHTGFSMPIPKSCPACNAVDSLMGCGPGVERIAEETAALWPDARIAVLSSDTAPRLDQMKEILSAMEEGRIDILVATQLVAKGHHFPNLTFVGVVDADMGLAGGDLRAAERTYQLLSQVAGRAGRESRPGEAMLQTFDPSAPVLEALVEGDRDGFLEAEAASRQSAGFPPFGRLAAVILKSKDEAALRLAAEGHRKAVIAAEGVEVWGPAPAPIYRLRGVARIRFLVKARRDVSLQDYVRAWLSGAALSGGVRRTVDIDPYSFL